MLLWKREKLKKTIGFVTGGKKGRKNSRVSRCCSCCVWQHTAFDTDGWLCSEERGEANDARADECNEEPSSTAVGAGGTPLGVVHAKEEEGERHRNADGRAQNLHDVLVEEVALEELEAECAQEGHVQQSVHVEGGIAGRERALGDEHADCDGDRADDPNDVWQSHGHRMVQAQVM